MIRSSQFQETITQVTARADVTLDNYNRAKAQQTLAAQHRSQQDRAWTKPSAGKIKCNIDVAFKINQNVMGVAIYLRNDQGVLLKAMVKCFPFCIEVHEGEALGLFTAINWVKDLGYSNVIFELDAKIVVDSFNKNREEFSEFGAIIADCQHNLSSFLSNSSVEFARKETNVVAHTLAGVATCNASSHIFYEIPRCIEDFILREMT